MHNYIEICVYEVYQVCNNNIYDVQQSGLVVQNYFFAYYLRVGVAPHEVLLRSIKYCDGDRGSRRVVGVLRRETT